MEGTVDEDQAQPVELAFELQPMTPAEAGEAGAEEQS